MVSEKIDIKNNILKICSFNWNKNKNSNPSPSNYDVVV
ncbi:hypothetical protein CPK_ORF00753 [Chlamydia pneumoniae LPCoLN]|nr:hypothetical protein CPK_ORF00753 [Chlamydia pneumoniae LPCoLN]